MCEETLKTSSETISLLTKVKKSLEGLNLDWADMAATWIEEMIDDLPAADRPLTRNEATEILSSLAQMMIAIKRNV